MALTASSARVGAVVGHHAESLLRCRGGDAIAGGRAHRLVTPDDVPHQEGHLDDAEEHQAQERRDQGGLDRDRAAFGCARDV